MAIADPLSPILATATTILHQAIPSKLNARIVSPVLQAWNEFPLFAHQIPTLAEQQQDQQTTWVRSRATSTKMEIQSIPQKCPP
jgi:hypothetical protein